MLQIKRDGQVQTSTCRRASIGGTVMDRRDDLAVRDGHGQARARRGVQVERQRNWEWTLLIVQTLGGLFTRETSVKQLMGPVAIADLSGAAARGRLDRAVQPDGDDQPEPRHCST